MSNIALGIECRNENADSWRAWRILHAVFPVTGYLALACPRDVGCLADDHSCTPFACTRRSDALRAALQAAEISTEGSLEMFVTILNCATVVIALFTLAMVFKTRAEQEKLRRRQKRAETRHAAVLMNEFRQIAAFLELRDLLQPVRPLPMLREWAISPDFGLLLVDLIDEHRPRVIVEFGGGSSTLVCAYRASQATNCGIHSYDHDDSFAQRTREQLQKHGLDSHAEIHYEPLRPSQFLDDAGEVIEWYGGGSIENLPADIDMIVVDGPPSHLNPWARYPSLPAVYDKLSPDCLLILDDAARKSEQQVVERWLKEFPEFRLQSPSTEKGAAVLVRGSRSISI
ncbi:class I SAM-dependent methyltransferase [Salinisphaera sp.]|uniref:class I SAM-dependent methyltransferase n=1 Tax=Salinisphaera sp. TaxID=1914330 RepID=UPI002D773E72|nr:class I SAM-dependent methyltransferase [Salinisphaera sp.]HET7315119.1 class I SAM-dependent methyltransferase [Salinisphaera sp.]